MTALEPAFYPAVVPRLVGFGLDPAVWGAFLRAFRVEAALQRLGRLVGDLVAEADWLLSSAHWFDPLRDWQGLIDLAWYEKVSRLRGEALLAWEHRVAAEVLLRAHERLVEQDLAAELAPMPKRAWAPRHYRIGHDPRDLDGVLTEFGLSPHPSVFVVLEGEIEERILRRFFDERLRPGWETYIRLTAAGGKDRNVTVLAELLAPTVAGQEGDLVLLGRPPSRIVLVLDRESNLATDAGREARRRQWVDALANGIPIEWRSLTRADIDGLVDILDWGTSGHNFEFAHFTDEQLATAILAVSRSPDAPSFEDLVLSVAAARDKARSLDSVYSRWARPRPNKAVIVAQLVPELVARMHHELDAGHPSLPLAVVALRVLELAWQTPRHGSVVLRAEGRPTG